MQFSPFLNHSIKHIYFFYRLMINRVKKHPFFWSDNKKLDFICKISERIPRVADRNQNEMNFERDFAGVQTQKLGGLLWFQRLPQRPKWGSGNQRTPQGQFFQNGLDGSSIGQLRFIRNVWVHRVQSVQGGHWASEEEIKKIFLGTFPWLVTELYQLCNTYFQVELEGWIQSI